MLLKKVVLGILLISWMTIIFLFSNQTMENSTSLSDSLLSNIIDIVSFKKLNKHDKKITMEKLSIVIRKIAHFTEYFILGIILYFNLKLYSLDNRLIIGIILCFLYASSDEIHQLFIDGRSARIFDIFIDTLGSSCSLFLLSYFIK